MKFWHIGILTIGLFMMGVWSSPSFSGIQQYRVDPNLIEVIEISPTIVRRHASHESEPRPQSKLLQFSSAEKIQLTYHFVQAKRPTTSKAIIISSSDPQIALYFNGIPLTRIEQMTIHAPGSGPVAAMADLPPAFFLNGRNKIQITVVPDDPMAIVGTVFIGPRDQLATAFARHTDRTKQTQQIGILSAFLIVFFGLGALILAKFRAPHLWATGIGIAAIYTRLPILSGTDFYSPTALAYLSVSVISILLTGYFLSVLKPNPTVRAVMLSLIVLSAVLLASSATMGWFAKFPRILSSLIISTQIAVVLWQYFNLTTDSSSNNNGYHKGTTLLAAMWVFATILVVFGDASNLLPRSIIWASVWSWVVMIPIIVATIQGLTVIRLYRERITLKTRLLAEIKTQELLLSEKEKALQAEIRHSARMEERERITRDMHDGVGGQLLSLLVRVRSGRLNLSQIENEIQSGLNDIRLMVDSMDHLEDDIEKILATFRARVTEQLRATNIAMEWRQDAPLDFPVGKGRWTLNIYRILQEAVSNVIRHSKANNLLITINQVAPGEAITFCVEDNGRGINSTTIKEGRGLANMRARATQLGGSLEADVGYDGRGTRITLALPYSACALSDNTTT